MISATAPAGIDVADYLDNEVVPALENIGGVARVELSGARDEYLRIVLDEAAMRSMDCPFPPWLCHRGG